MYLFRSRYKKSPSPTTNSIPFHINNMRVFFLFTAWQQLVKRLWMCPHVSFKRTRFNAWVIALWVFFMVSLQHGCVCDFLGNFCQQMTFRTASWRSETMLLAKLLSFAVDYLIWLLPWWRLQKDRTEKLIF